MSCIYSHYRLNYNKRIACFNYAVFRNYRTVSFKILKTSINEPKMYTTINLNSNENKECNKKWINAKIFTIEFYLKCNNL